MFKQVIVTLKKKAVLWSVCIISLYALYLRLHKLSSHALWGDEYGTLVIMKGSFLDMLKVMPKHEFCAFLSGDYYLMYPFFKIFGYNKWGLAIPHIISTILGFYFLYKVSQRFFRTLWGYLITFLIACFNLTLINHATEVRTYAVLPTLALACFYFADILVQQNISMKIKSKVAIGALFVLTIWFHLYGIFMPYLSVLFFLLSKSREKDFKIIFKDVFKFMFIVSIIAAPLWIISVFGPHLSTGEFLGIDTFAFIPNPVENIVGFLKGVFGNLLGNKRLYFLFISVVFPFLVPFKERRAQIGFLLIMILLPVEILFLSDLINKYFFVQRQLIWVMPYFAFFLGWTWESLFLYLSERRRK